jgi:leucine dehydrogenase
MEIVRRETTHVAVFSVAPVILPLHARGVFRAMQAAAKFVWKPISFRGLQFALAGLRQCGVQLAKHLHLRRETIVSDVDPQKTLRLVEQFNAVVVETEEISGVRADVFAPCALGGVHYDQYNSATSFTNRGGRCQQSTSGRQAW